VLKQKSQAETATKPRRKQAGAQNEGLDMRMIKALVDIDNGILEQRTISEEDLVAEWAYSSRPSLVVLRGWDGWDTGLQVGRIIIQNDGTLRSVLDKNIYG